MEDSAAMKKITDKVTELRNFLTQEFGITEFTEYQNRVLAEIVASAAAKEYCRGQEQGLYRAVTDFQKLVLSYSRAVIPELNSTAPTNNSAPSPYTNDAQSDDAADANQD